MFGKDWRTTVAGLFLGLGLAFTQLGGAVDDNPATKFSGTDLLAALSMIGGAVGLGYFAKSTQ